MLSFVIIVIKLAILLLNIKYITKCTKKITQRKYILVSYFNKVLIETCRRNIIETAVEYSIENNIHASPKCMEHIADGLTK